MATPQSLLRRLTLSVLMPLVLLLSQQGALLHELSHWHVPSTSAAASASARTQAQASDVDSDFCLTCLSFAQVGGLAKFELPVAPKLESLAYHFATEPVRHVAELALPAARSRGPPRTV
jgi:hypothetical protein